MRSLLFLLGAVLLAPLATRAADPLVFASALASGEKGAIHAFRFDAKTGALQPLARTTDLQSPFFLGVSPDHRYLYAVDVEKVEGKAQEFIAAYAIRASSGELKRLNRQPSHGVTACYIDVDATGKTVAVANYTTGNVATFPVLPDGSLGEAVSLAQFTGSSVDPKRQKESHAHSIVISPDHRFALCADLGADKVMIFHLDSATAKLAPNEAQPFAEVPPGSGPRHMVFHPDGRRLYVIHEMANTISAFDYEPASARLTERQNIATLPSDFTGKSYTADLKITPDGHFLYGTNRGHDSIVSYRIGENGRLTLLGHEPSRGKGPQNLVISPDGQWLLCANMPGQNIAVFHIDHETGKLIPAGEPVAMPMPSCLRWVD